jgi:NodT family efflux transporter outer membrane factor (OMF) lipoprotein
MHQLVDLQSAWSPPRGIGWTAPHRAALQHRFRLAACVCALILLSGCAQLGPAYRPPEVELAETWQLPEGTGLVAEGSDPIAWWQTFNDPILTHLVEQAYQHNYSLEVAGLRVLEARAQLGIAIGSAYPQNQQAVAGATRLRVSRSNANTSAGDLDYVQYNMGVNVGWELDFWGRFRNGIESADASFLASIADYDNVLVLLAAQVAETYATIRTLEEQLRVARKNLELQQRSYDIAEVKFRNGQDSELDMQQALTLLLSTQATVPALQAQLLQTRNALATLLAIEPAAIADLLTDNSSIPSLPESVAVGVPADLLRRRPDIRSAELAAVAQSHVIGIAEADLYPTFTLIGTLGLSAAGSTSSTRNGNSGFSQLADSDSLQFSAGPQFSWNLLNYGRIKDSVRVQDARYQQLLVNYQDLVLRAAAEVENAMVEFLNGKRQSEILERTVTSAQRSSELAVLRYQEGYSDYQRVLDAQQSLFNQQQRYVDAQGATVRGLVSLYKALGGGWQVRADAPLVDEATRQEMDQRTDWGDLLEPSATDPSVAEPDGTFRKPDA